MDWFYRQVGNFGIAILLLTLTMKILFFPLANRSYRMMSKMKKLTPKMNEMKEKYGDDRVKINQEMMSLYKKEKVNPLSGCLPIVLQIPVFFSLYKVLFVTIEMRHAPFYGWIHDLSEPDPTNIFTLFGAIPWHTPDMLHLGLWPLIMGVTMFLQQRLNPTPTDPVQAKVFMFMPLMFMVMLAKFPSGLVIYWAWNNTLSICQQWVIMRRSGAA
jgi:YidC/Oxa1 family membrane protein insertase